MGIGIGVGHFALPITKTITILQPAPVLVPVLPVVIKDSSHAIKPIHTGPSPGQIHVWNQSPIVGIDTMPDIYYYPFATDTTKDSTHVFVLSETYVYGNNDSAVTVHTITIDPRPREVDSIKYPVPVYVPVEQPTILKPLVAYPVGILIGIIGAAVYINNIKK